MRNDDRLFAWIFGLIMFFAAIALGVAVNQVSRDNAAHDAWIEFCTNGGVPLGTCELSWKHGPEGM